MYTIRRGKNGEGQFLADGPVYTTGTLPSPIWQHLDGDRQPYMEPIVWNALQRKNRLAKIYVAHELSVVKLTDEQLECIAFRKLRGY